MQRGVRYRYCAGDCCAGCSAEAIFDRIRSLACPGIGFTGFIGCVPARAGQPSAQRSRR